MTRGGASATARAGTHGRCRACRPLGTAHGLATRSWPPSLAISMWGAVRLQSTACPQRPRKTRGTPLRGETLSSVSRSPLDNRVRVRQQGESLSSGNPHRPQAILLLCRFLLFFSASGRIESRLATLKPYPESQARSPRRTQINPAPTRQNSCRRIRHYNCRGTPLLSERSSHVARAA